MTPIRNWWEVLTRAWSVRFAAASLAFEMGAQLLPYIADGWPPQVARLASIACVVGVLVTRFIDQQIGGDDE